MNIKPSDLRLYALLIFLVAMAIALNSYCLCGELDDLPGWCPSSRGRDKGILIMFLFFSCSVVCFMRKSKILGLLFIGSGLLIYLLKPICLT